MHKSIIFLFVVLILTTEHTILADTGSGVSSAGSLTSMPPAAPTLDSPANGATDVLSSDVTWNSVDHAASYNLQVSTVSNFSSTLADESGLTGTTYTVPGLSGAVTYFWHVSGTNVSGTGDYSGTWQFTTDASLPVTLSSFSAKPVPCGILIQWTTESETDNLGFILERASSFNNGSGWIIIASYQTQDALKGQGNTSQRTDYSFLDETIQPGQIYTYRLSDVNTRGDVNIYDMIRIDLPDAPEMTVLDQPFPNPFNPQTKISYHLSKPGFVEINIFDLIGRKVETLTNENQQAGSYTLYWYGQDRAGNPMASGTYLIVLKTDSEIRKQKAVLMH
ncbi:T9SS type A sorting domain-containing protein [bacterium]|nr:T9SS type A sorting domain-containing protein [bacterium]